MILVKSLFEKYQITAYLFGHHHAMQYTKWNGIHYIQVGSTGKTESVCENSVGWGLNHQHGFALMKLQDQMQMTFYNSSFHGQLRINH
jgi:acid phosphatase